ncbi:hypothetical protein HNQ71_007053 [Mesorhizobium sangaii]|uniref:Tc1-like transposase DDE domain-containing protein n=1 Tax=Mesorhizobium sangaii TaxID=505389 RepID=A0A841PL55_9HYPH|nr:hypothetical protein [Mesorhizobium sangaii]
MLLLDRAGWHTTAKLKVPRKRQQQRRDGREPRNSTRSRTSGNICAPTGSPTAPSTTTPSSTLGAHLADLPKGKPVEVWFQDEARIGQKNGVVRQWARRGTRPRQPADQRYQSAYLFGAICPARGKGAALALPFADTAAMQLHLDEISRVSPLSHSD